MTKKRKIDEMISPLGEPLKQVVRQQTARHTRVGDARDAERALCIADVAHSLPARMWTNPEKDWSAKERRADGPWSVICQAKKRQPYISTRLLPALAILMDKKISPGFVELASPKPDHHYGIRAAKSLEDAQARFVPNDFLPGSSYTQGTQGAYATGTAVSTEVVREAVDLMDKKCDEVARTDAQASDRRFTTAVIAFVEGPGKGENFILIPYTGLGTQGKSSIHSRFLDKFTDKQLISRFWRTCAFIASEKVGGIEAHMRIFNVVMITLPMLNELFIHAGNAYGTILEFQHDIEALIGGAFVGGRLADGGLNVAELGSGTLDSGCDLSRGFGPQAYGLMDTLAVRSRVPRKQVEGRAAYKVFKKYPAVCQKIVELQGLLKEKTTTVGVLARADAKTRGDRIPTMKQLTAGEVARWLNAAGGRGYAAERERLFAIPDDELTISDRAKKGRIPRPPLPDRLARFRSTPRGPSGFRGLTKARGKWIAQFSLIPASGGKTKKVNLGTYVTEQDAARAYDAALMTIEGIELSDRNYPDDPEPTPAAIEKTRAMLATKLSPRTVAKSPSGFRGLTKAGGKWKAQLSLIPASGGNKKKVNLGTYVTEQDAARAYDAALMTIEGIKLSDRNLPDDPEPTPAAIEKTRAMLATKLSPRTVAKSPSGFRGLTKAGGNGRRSSASSRRAAARRCR